MAISPPLLADRYRRIRRLGSGGMATVYLAEDTRLGREVAVKQLHAEGTEEMRRRFDREARLGASLKHPNLVTVYDIGGDEATVLIVMEYVAGETLRDRMRAGPLDHAEALDVLAGVAAALDYAHSHGIVHRDVKPANVLLGPKGAVKLADLGIATASETTRITRTGSLLGSPAYMAPEQLGGGRVTPAVDVYAFAALAFEVLSGRRPRAGGTLLEVLEQVANAPPPNLHELDPRFPVATGEALAWGMAKDPLRRAPSAGRLFRAVADSLAPTTPTAPPRPAVGPEPFGASAAAAGAAGARPAGVAPRAPVAPSGAPAGAAPVPAPAAAVRSGPSSVDAAFAPAPVAATAAVKPAPQSATGPSAPASVAAAAAVKPAPQSATGPSASASVAEAAAAKPSPSPVSAPPVPAPVAAAAAKTAPSPTASSPVPAPARAAVSSPAPSAPKPAPSPASVRDTSATRPVAAGAAGRASAPASRPAGRPTPPTRTSARTTHTSRPNRRAGALALGALAAAGVAGGLIVAGGLADDDPPARAAQPEARTATPTPSPTAAPRRSVELAPAAALPPLAEDGRSPTRAVEAFYQRAAEDRFARSWALAGPGFRSAFETRGGLEATLGSLQSIEFRRLEVSRREGDSATVTVSTVARHTKRTDRCQGPLSAVRGEDGIWRVDPAPGGVACTIGPPSAPTQRGPDLK